MTPHSPSGMEVDNADATPVILMAILMFVLPAEPIGRATWGGETRKLLDWKSVHEKCPWGVLLILGGGFALAEGSEKSCKSYVHLQSPAVSYSRSVPQA